MDVKRQALHRRTWLTLAALLLLGLWLRLDGITFGLPFNYHNDEALYVASAYESSRASIHPLFGPLQIAILAEQRVLEPVLRLAGALELRPEIAATLESPTMVYHLLGRWSSAVLGTATILVLFFVGRRLGGEALGLVAAAALTVCFNHVRSSHYGVPDVWTAFFVLACLAFCLRIQEEGRLRDYLCAGLFSGLAVPAKLLAWPVIIAPAAFHWAGFRVDRERAGASSPKPPREQRSRLRNLFSGKLIAAYLVAAVVFLLFAPQNFLFFREMLEYWKQAAEMGRLGGLDRFALDEGGALLTYLDSLLWGLGIPMALCAGIGFVGMALAPDRPAVRLFLLFPVTYLLFLFRPANLYFARYLVAITPFFALAAAWTVVRGLNALPLGRRWRWLASVVTLALVLGPPLVSSLRHNWILGSKDTRTLAKEWIEENVPEQALVVIEGWTFSPQLATVENQTPFSKAVYRVGEKRIYGLSERSNSMGPSRGLATVEDYRRQGVLLLVSNSYTWRSRLIDPAEDRAKRAFYESLDEDADLLVEFSPFADGEEVPRIFAESYGPAIGLFKTIRPGPIIRIYLL